jgi:ABC-type sulfate transport system substrate-binding protein
MPNGHFTQPLPLGLTVDDVFCDFFRYIKENVQVFVANSYTSGDRYWNELAETTVVILTTPNGWEGKYQNRMREAAINAELLVGDRVRERVRFVSEGEVT